MLDFLIACISASSTIGAAVIAYMANEKRNEILKTLAENENVKSLSKVELYEMSLPGLSREIEDTVPNDANKPADCFIIYPGSNEFRSYENESASGRTVEYSFSNVEVTIDGTDSGSGDGYKGFQISKSLSLGRHDLVFTWRGTREVSTPSEKDGWQFRESDLSGRSESTIWVARPVSCKLYLGKNFQFDHAVPPTIVPSCGSCSMPGLKVCKCGRPYCNNHKAIIDDQERCLLCKKDKMQFQFRVSGILVAIAFVTFLYWWY